MRRPFTDNWNIFYWWLFLGTNRKTKVIELLATFQDMAMNCPLFYCIHNMEVKYLRIESSTVNYRSYQICEKIFLQPLQGLFVFYSLLLLLNISSPDKLERRYRITHYIKYSFSSNVFGMTIYGGESCLNFKYTYKNILGQLTMKCLIDCITIHQ